MPNILVVAIDHPTIDSVKLVSTKTLAAARENLQGRIADSLEAYHFVVEYGPEVETKELDEAGDGDKPMKDILLKLSEVLEIPVTDMKLRLKAPVRAKKLSRQDSRREKRDSKKEKKKKTSKVAYLFNGKGTRPSIAEATRCS